MLQLNPLVSGLGDAESWVFDLLAPLWLLAEDGRLGQLSVRDIAEYIGEFTDTLFDAARARYNSKAAMFIEKTPGHAHLVPFLRAVYPNARYLHLIRDGRDVARSLSQMRFTQLPDAADAAANWGATLHAVRISTADLSPHQFREVRYEALRARPTLELERLWEWFGLAAGHETRLRINEIAGQRVSTWSGTETPIGAESWRTLPERELGRVYARIGRTLVAEGYLAQSDLRRWRRNPSYVFGRFNGLAREAARRFRAHLSAPAPKTQPASTR
jgi:hypothetical protein